MYFFNFISSKVIKIIFSVVKILKRIIISNQKVYRSTSYNDLLAEIDGCKIDQPWLILIHGFMEACDTAWINTSVLSSDFQPSFVYQKSYKNEN